MALNKRLISTDSAGGINGLDHFEIFTYTATENDLTLNTTNGFAPDLVIGKNRVRDATPFELYDTVRGSNIIGDGRNMLRWPYQNAESDSAYYGHCQFNSDGITLIDQSNRNFPPLNNPLGDNHVLYAWKGGGADVTNTDGDITSQVSANQEAGFSIVKNTSSSNINHTIGHGLLQTPQLRITKSRTATSRWDIYTNAYGSGWYNWGINFGDIPSSVSGTWSTSTTIKSNATSGDYIHYLFHEVDGYQKFGTYSGTQSSNPINVGFQPRWVFTKAIAGPGGGSAVLADSARSGKWFSLSSTNNENGSLMSFTSTGFTLTGNNQNGNGYTFLYWAIA